MWEHKSCAGRSSFSMEHDCLCHKAWTKKSAEVLSQQYNIVAMVIFCISRFICTFILRYLNAGKLLMILAIFGGVFTLGAIFLQNIYGIYCLVAISACMSLMFPTIYGIALKGMGDDAQSSELPVSLWLSWEALFFHRYRQVSLIWNR